VLLSLSKTFLSDVIKLNLIKFDPADVDVADVRPPVDVGTCVRPEGWCQKRLQDSQLAVATHPASSSKTNWILPIQIHSQVSKL
jgi:hypothetical protein